MKLISYMLDSVSDVSSHPDQPVPQRRPPSGRRTPRSLDGGPVGTILVALPAVTPDEEACSAFDRRPPLEAMASQWLTRSNVVTVYDCGSQTDANGSVYDAVFRLNSYVWIRSPAPVLRDDSMYP